MMGQPARGRGLPLFWKLLLPVIALVLIVGPAVTFTVVRDVAARGAADLDEDLLTQLLDARALLQERELRLLEAGSLAANLEGLTEAIQRADGPGLDTLLRSVLALKSDLRAVVVASTDGDVLAGLRRDDDGTVGPAPPLFTSMATSGTTDRSADVGELDGRPHLVVGTPVCAGVTSCDEVATVFAAVPLQDLVEAGASRTSKADGLALHATDGRILASTGLPAPRGAGSTPPASGTVRTQTRGEAGTVASLTGPWVVQGRSLGAVSVTQSAADTAVALRGTGRRLAAVLFLSMIAVVAVAGVVARSVLRQVRTLLATSRALGEGNLDARAPVLARDEIGELATVLNQMADEVRASRDNLEGRVRDRTAEVERLLRERTEFFASLSHELRTPLAVILHQSRMRLDPSYGRRSDVAAWTTVADTGEQLLATVNAILEVARAQAGRLEIDLGITDVTDVVTAAARSLDALARAADVTVALELGEPSQDALADGPRLEQVLRNLIDNAIKYTPSGGRVVISAAGDRDRVTIEVKDDGPGVPPDAVDRIFEAFFRAPATSPQRGAASSGLGLALARSLVEAQGGTLEYADAPGGGACFVVTVRAASVGEGVALPVT